MDSPGKLATVVESEMQTPLGKTISMKAYIITTGVIFGLITLAHIWRITKEPHLATDPFFFILTILAAALCVWAWVLFRRGSRL